MIAFMLKIIVIADDLTGANDTGVQFSKVGMSAHVIMDISADLQSGQQADVLVFDTDSRAVRPAEADRRVHALCQKIKTDCNNFSMVYKKIDSTLRGNIGVEIDAALDGLALEWAAVVPAFPKTGRITAGGYHLLQQVPLAESEISRDPKAPVTDSLLPNLLGKQSRHKVGHIFLKTVYAGVEAIIGEIKGLRAEECKLISFDATTENHLTLIALALIKSGPSMLWVGSAGLAEKIPDLMGWASTTPTVVQPPSRGPALIVAGSVSKVTAGQVRYLMEQGTVCLVAVHADQLITDKATEVKRCIDKAKAHLENGDDVILASATDTDAVEKARDAGNNKGMELQAISEAIADALGEIVQTLVTSRIAGLFLTGGDTAVAVCRALQVGAIEVTAEVAPGIPLGKLSGGICTGMTVVTKAGAFGTENAIAAAVELLRVRKG